MRSLKKREKALKEIKIASVKAMAGIVRDQFSDAVIRYERGNEKVHVIYYGDKELSLLLRALSYKNIPVNGVRYGCQSGSSQIIFG